MTDRKQSSKGNEHSERKDHWYNHPAVWVGSLSLLLFVFLALVSWRPASRWLSSLADKTAGPAASPEVVLLNDAGGRQTPVTVNTTSTPGGQNPGGGGSGGGGNGGGGGTGIGDGRLTEDGVVPEFYNQVGNGDTLPQLVGVAGTPDDCIETTLSSVLGKQKVCSWYNDDSSVIVTLVNDQVVAKTKVDY